MKIPVVPIHVVTSKTLGALLRAARDEGVAEGKAFSRRQIEVLLGRRAIKPFKQKDKKKVR